MDSIEQGVLIAIDTHGPLSVAALASTLDAHPITIDRHCAGLQERGHLRLRSGGVYMLTETGKEHLATLPE